MLYATTPPIRAAEPAVPSELGEYVASSSVWTVPSDQQLVLDEMRKASPLARHLAAYYLRHDASLVQRFREELESFLRGLTGALGVPVKRIEVQIPASDVVIPARPSLSAWSGSSALANGAPFARRLADGSEAGVYPARPAAPR